MGEGTDLMERVVERSNMLRALRRLESNKGATGGRWYGDKIPSTIPERILAGDKGRVTRG